MKKNILSLCLAVILLLISCITVFGATMPKYAYKSSYDADTGYVSVSVYVTDPIGVQGGNLWLAFDEAMFEYKDNETSKKAEVVVAGKTATDEGLCSCAFMFTDACSEENLEEDGTLLLATYRFKTLSENYDINDFYLWSTSFDYNDVDIAEEMSAEGNEKHADDHENIEVVIPSKSTDTKSSTTSSSSSSNGKKTYMYIIFGVIAIVAIAGIAFVAVKNSHNPDKTDDADKKESENSSEDNVQKDDSNKKEKDVSDSEEKSEDDNSDNS